MYTAPPKEADRAQGQGRVDPPSLKLWRDKFKTGAYMGVCLSRRRREVSPQSFRRRDNRVLGVLLRRVVERRLTVPVQVAGIGSIKTDRVKGFDQPIGKIRIEFAPHDRSD